MALGYLSTLHNKHCGSLIMECHNSHKHFIFYSRKLVNFEFILKLSPFMWNQKILSTLRFFILANHGLVFFISIVELSALTLKLTWQWFIIKVKVVSSIEGTTPAHLNKFYHWYSSLIVECIKCCSFQAIYKAGVLKTSHSGLKFFGILNGFGGKAVFDKMEHLACFIG